MEKNYHRDVRWEAYCQRVHLEKLNSIKPVVDVKSPNSFSHLETRSKWIQIQSDKLTEIERENFRLMQRMDEIKNRKHNPSELDHLNFDYEKYSHSLNREKRLRDQERIKQENYALQRRMTERVPEYSRKKILEEQEKQIKYLKNCSQYPPPPDSLKKQNLKQSMKKDNSFQPYSQKIRIPSPRNPSRLSTPLSSTGYYQPSTKPVNSPPKQKVKTGSKSKKDLKKKAKEPKRKAQSKEKEKSKKREEEEEEESEESFGLSDSDKEDFDLDL